MTSLSLVHKNRDASDTDIVPRKTYFAGLKEFYVELGYNIRDIDQQHVEEFRDAFIAGEDIPALIVQVTDKGLKIIDGHHRYFGAVMATKAGHEVARLECKDAKGSEADRIALMVTSSQGRALLPLERAAAYQRLLNQGWTEAEIARKVKRSVADVEHHIQLLECGDELIGMVRAGEVAATTAVSMSREFGTKAGSVATEELAKAKAAGKKKLTKAAAIPQFNATKARRLVELMASFEFRDEGYSAADDVYLEAMGILAEFRDFLGKPSTATDNLAAPEAEIPLSKEEMIKTSGIEVWACAAAAFGDKLAFTFSESKYAHTWALDCVSKPEVVVIPQETIAKAMTLIMKYQGATELRNWLNDKCADEQALEDMHQRFMLVADEMMKERPLLIMAEFISIIEGVDSESWKNIRMLRSAISEVGRVKAEGVEA